jgi:cytochrome oxidase Cu insertion factor (SCO1/SenC/PrrC family)
VKRLIIACIALLGLLVVVWVGIGLINDPERGGLPTAQIGGPFTLVDQTGRTVTDRDFRGRPMLVYFGYTYCPDVCPTGLSVMGTALDELEKDAGKVASIFVTVDPDRDTAEVMQGYVSHFHPTLTGLTGSVEQVTQAAKAYKVYFRLNPPDKDGGYLVDHTSIIYLMDKSGRFVRHFTHTSKPDEIAAALRKVL